MAKITEKQWQRYEELLDRLENEDEIAEFKRLKHRLSRRHQERIDKIHRKYQRRERQS